MAFRFLATTLPLLPKHVLDYTAKRFPKYLTAPEKWTEPNVSSFEMYARDRKPKA